MPVYMDVHEVGPEVTAEDIAKAHASDVQVQDKYGVRYEKYYFNEKAGKIFCLCHAPNTEAAVRVHKEAHGLVANKLIQIEPEMADLLMGAGEIDRAGAAVFPVASADERDPGTRTILFTDIVNATSLTQEIGDEAAMDLVHLHDRVVRDALTDLGGREVKHTGDGIMASFVSAASAVRCASRVQWELSKQAEKESERSIKVRIGLAAGEPVEHHDDLFGCTVQMAARLCAHAQPDQILVSNVVAELCAGKKVAFQEFGEVSLKGFDRPVVAHVVAWANEPGVVN